MKKAELFYKIAALAIDTGRELCLVDEDTQSISKALNGAILDSHNDSRRLSLAVYPPEADSRREEAGDGST